MENKVKLPTAYNVDQKFKKFMKHYTKQSLRSHELVDTNASYL